MTRHPLITYRTILLGAFLVLFAISAIRPPYPEDFIWEHLLTAAALAFIGWLEWIRRPLSNLAYTFLFLFLCLHVLGAHYTYSEVPYDDWSRRLFGTSISVLIGQDSDRNHFDRMVHFLFGVLLMHPMREIVERWMKVCVGHAIVIAGLFMVTFGTVYEQLEWLYAEFAGQEAAERYNGQQGDVFDPQKDITLNVLGSIIGGAISALIPSKWITPEKQR
jgi:putative membrane protein